MWTQAYSKTFKGIKREDIWRLWTDVSNWPKWHDGAIEYCKIDGAFEVGNHFMLKPKDERPVKIVLTEIDEGLKFVDRTIFFGATMYVTHAMEETSEGTYTFVVVGLLAWLWVKIVAKNIADAAPPEMELLINFAKDAKGNTIC